MLILSKATKQIVIKILLPTPRNVVSRLLVQLYPYYLLGYWINDESVRDALHVNKSSIGKWERCTYQNRIPYNKDINNSIPYHMNNSISGYRSLIYR
jgi:hypothetical protein